ncbi:hypothetical protein SynA18461_01912 [Synechococcus sp. A18-46.1]|nr:hypothetical protein SynA18461_01912 [Synechococcus sp. A18-46.1]
MRLQGAVPFEDDYICLGNLPIVYRLHVSACIYAVFVDF